MKTAMQELIEFIDNEVLLNKQYIESPRLRLGAEIAKSKALTLLDKEKQQIIDAYKAGEVNIAGILMEDFNRLHGTSHKVPANDGGDAEKYFKEKFSL